MHVDNKDISADSKIELKGISEIYDETLDLFSLRCSIEIIVYTVLFSLNTVGIAAEHLSILLAGRQEMEKRSVAR